MALHSMDEALELADQILGRGRAVASLKEVADGLTISVAKIRADIRRGLVDPTRLGGRIALSRQQIADYVLALETDYEHQRRAERCPDH